MLHSSLCSLPSGDRSIPGCVRQEADSAYIMSMETAFRTATHGKEGKEAGLGRGEKLQFDAIFKVSADPLGSYAAGVVLLTRSKLGTGDQALKCCGL